MSNKLVEEQSLTKSKRKRLRRRQKNSTGENVNLTLPCDSKKSDEPSTVVEKEEIVVIKTKGFYRNEARDRQLDYNLKYWNYDPYYEHYNHVKNFHDDNAHQFDTSRSEDVMGYIGDQDLEYIMNYIEGEEKKKSQDRKKFTGNKNKPNNSRKRK